MSQQCHIIVMDSSLYLHLNCYCAFFIFILFVNGCAPCSIQKQNCKFAIRSATPFAVEEEARDIKMASPEYSVVKAHIADINSRISAADISSYANELLQAGIICDAGHDNAIAVTGRAPQDKIASCTHVRSHGEDQDIASPVQWTDHHTGE